MANSRKVFGLSTEILDSVLTLVYENLHNFDSKQLEKLENAAHFEIWDRECCDLANSCEPSDDELQDIEDEDQEN